MRLSTVASLDLGSGAAALAATGDRVFVALPNGHVRAFAAMRPWFVLEPARAPRSLAASADGRFLLVTCARGNNWIYDLTGPRPTLFRRWERKTGQTEGLNQDGRLLVRGDVRGQVRGYELAGYKLKWLVTADRLAISPDGRWVLGLDGRSMTALDAATGAATGGARTARGPVQAMALAAADRVAWLETSGTGCAIELAGSGATRTLPAVACPPRSSLAFSPSGGLLALAAGSELVLVDGRTGRLLARLPRPGKTILAVPIDDRSVVATGLDEGRITWLRLAAPEAPASTPPR